MDWTFTSAECEALHLILSTFSQQNTLPLALESLRANLVTATTGEPMGQLDSCQDRMIALGGGLDGENDVPALPGEGQSSEASIVCSNNGGSISGTSSLTMVPLKYWPTKTWDYSSVSPSFAEARTLPSIGLTPNLSTSNSVQDKSQEHSPEDSEHFPETISNSGTPRKVLESGTPPGMLESLSFLPSSLFVPIARASPKTQT